MRFNKQTLKYLHDCGAILQKSEYKVIDVDFEGLRAYVNKVDTYKKRNGKLAFVEHHFGRWVIFPKELISWGQKKYSFESSDWSVGDRETVTGSRPAKYLNKEAKAEIIKLYNKPTTT